MPATSKSEPSALARATDAAAYRIETIAATEASTAFQDEQQAQLGRLIQQREARWVGVVMKLWDSKNDKRRCSVCANATDDVRPVGMDYDAGAPGHVHPRCRCRSALIVLPANYERDA